MNEKRNDPIFKEKKVNIKPKSLNYLYKYFVPKNNCLQNKLFWLPISKPVSETPVVQPVPVKPVVPRELPLKSLVKRNLQKLKSHLDSFAKVVKVRTKVTAQNEGTRGFEHIRKAFEQDVIPFMKSLQETFQVFDKGLQTEINEMKVVFNQMESQNAPEFKEFFEINNLKAQLKGKDTTISHLKKHIANLKGKAVDDCSETVNCSRVIASRMYKLDLEPLSLKLRKNREAHVDYLNKTKEHANTLRVLVEQDIA
ncbi:hypothetical protein Tco_0772307 [Tanacetum coccineum]|uniref:Uncharacterized protein n=1 Tax=Tanacetum coccineum TaxID=301880 RepID=A0ABQ4ZK40_9ASTR